MAEQIEDEVDGAALALVLPVGVPDDALVDLEADAAALETPRVERVRVPGEALEERELLPWNESAAIHFAQIICRDMPLEDPLVQRWRRQGLALLAGFEPKDGVEKMLLMQMLWTHGRSLALNRWAGVQTRPSSAEVLHSLADRASNTYRRQMEALREYRKPRQRRKQSIIIRTAHIAAQQIVGTRVMANDPARLEAMKEVMGEAVNDP